MAMVAALEAQLSLPRPVRIHWTGCPNSCGQAQVSGGAARGKRGGASQAASCRCSSIIGRRVRSHTALCITHPVSPVTRAAACVCVIRLLTSG